MSETVRPAGRAGVADLELAAQLDGYRHVREQLERQVLAVATSVDGRSFQVQASLYDLVLSRGGYVMLETEDRSWLGQITDMGIVNAPADVEGSSGSKTSIVLRLASGSGLVLDVGETPFHDAHVRPALPREVGAWFDRARPERAGLVVGELLSAPGVPAVLDSGGLNRHTFMCGQSGSGKTYSLGLLLERVLLETTLRMVVLDPNSDYVGLGRLREGADSAWAARYEHVLDQVAVWGSGLTCDHQLRLSFAELDSSVQGAVLALDPIRDRDEYAVLADLLRTKKDGRPLITGLDQLIEGSYSERQLGMRAANLGVLDYAVWGATQRSIVQELRNPTARCTVIDLGSLETVQEQRLVAEAALSTLWSTRLAREPCLVVIDEAHNVCPAEPHDPVSRIATEQVVQLAAEGRKYGLYLLTSTQRPYKVHENVVSQCDNLLLMRMNSQADIADLSRIFSFIPPGLMTGATAFRMGQALVGGRFFPDSGYVQMGRRTSQEGGADVPATWARPRELQP